MRITYHIMKDKSMRGPRIPIRASFCVVSSALFILCVRLFSLHDHIERQPPSKPSVLVEDHAAVQRGIYGGKGDAAHLGGFTGLDLQGICPNTWKHIMSDWVVKSVLDLGCGKGVSTLWFHLQGLDTLCVEGSHDATTHSFLPPSTIVEHDFTRGAWWPEKTYDLVWSVEFLEHVGTPYMQNYLPILKKGAVLVVTHSTWGGWHHVEVHTKEWWIRKLTTWGFVFSESLTKELHKYAHEGKGEAPKNHTYNAQHLWLNGLVFMNPSVSHLPQHAHLFTEHGCGEVGNKKPCDGQDTLPERYLPLPFDPKQQKQWERQVFPTRDMFL